ncbi:50S ribosomal protein L25/general stress protein Ctc [Desulfovibrionales bacterium]
MSEVVSLHMTRRNVTGKGPCARLRAQGLVPGVFYNSKGENILFNVDNTALGKAFEKVRYSKMLELHIEEGGQTEKRTVLFKKLVSHPVKRRYDHVDFIGIDLDKEVQVTVPVKTTGRAKGVVLGGKLEIIQEEVVVRCLPTMIPDAITVDVTELDIADKVLVDQLPLPEGVQAVYDRNYVVLTIQTSRAVKADGE